MNDFPKMAMSRFSQQTSDQFKGQNLVSMHNTNPEPFTQNELEQTIGRSFKDILVDVNLGFSPDYGSFALRQTLVNHHYEGIKEDEIITHAGAQEALFCVYNALLKEGDTVLVVTPLYEPLSQFPANIGCHVNYVHLDASNNWSLNLDEVEEDFKSGCRLFVINFPHNPTGATLAEFELIKIVELCRQYDVWLLSDEVFRGLEHSAKYRLPAVADIYEKGMSVGVISKGFGIPGIRVGWLVCKNKNFLKKINDVKAYLSVCNSQIDEQLASVILQYREKLVERNLKIILKNKEMLAKLSSILGNPIEVIQPNTGCCLFALIKTQQTREYTACTSVSEDMVKQLAEQTNFLLYPSALFETDVQGLRIGFGNKNFADFVQKVKS
jgi:aspartate/methionine/tyrosine aminotransferase